MSAGPKSLPRSPAGLLACQLTDEPLSRSSSAISSNSASSPLNHPPFERRSTGASDLDYYWSPFAGAGPNSSSSSLAVSPSPSNAGLGISPGPHNAFQRPLPNSSSGETSGYNFSVGRESSGALSAGGMNGSRNVGKIDTSGTGRYGQTLDIGYPHRRVESPGGWSGESDYSNEGEGAEQSFDISPHGSQSSASVYSTSSPVNYRAILSESGETKRGLLDSSPRNPRMEEYSNGTRASMTSQMTGTTVQPDEEDPNEKTPLAPVYVDKAERDIQPPGPMMFDQPHVSYPSPRQSLVTSPTKQQTPTRPIASPSAVGYTPSSGRLPFTQTSSPSRSSQQDGSNSRQGGSIPPPQSAPAWKSSFGDLQMVKPVEDEARSKRTTLPATASTSSVSLDAITSPERGMLSPDKYVRSGSVSPEKRDRGRASSPGRSPEPPPRSTLRALYTPRGSMETTRSTDNIPVTASLQHTSTDLPTIINTPHSPDTSAEKRDEPARPSRSPSRTPSMTNSATINDLTELLGGAIDAIGLIDSRDTPPPTVITPRKDRPAFDQGVVDLESHGEGAPITPSSLPSRGESLASTTSASTAMVPPPRPTEDVRRVPSGLSLRDVNRDYAQISAPLSTSPTTITNFSQRPWPAAMLYGNIKGMKYAGDRAKAYARNVNDLARAETGLKEWCIASNSSSSRPISTSAKSAALSALGIRANGPLTPSLNVPPSNHMRNVSSSSEFPMRADSYTAREISQRAVDPTDAPGSLPPNLPYPQLQAQYASGGLNGNGNVGMKSSASMQSVSSFSSKRSFFGGIGKKSSKKDGNGLGPPVGQMTKAKDVRGLQISHPSLNNVKSNHRLSESIAPSGPRNQRIGSFTPPPNNHIPLYNDQGRVSLDTGLTRLNQNRSSIDSVSSLSTAAVRKGSLPPRGQSGNNGGLVNEDELRAMGDILPHVGKSVLRVYLGKYGDQMQAIGMYLEDEKRGKVMRA